jgi:hypothetical protein
MVSIFRVEEQAKQKTIVKALPATCFHTLSCFAYSSILKIEKTCFSETFVDFQRTTWRYFPEDRTLLNTLFILLRSKLVAHKIKD